MLFRFVISYGPFLPFTLDQRSRPSKSSLCIQLLLPDPFGSYHARTQLLDSVSCRRGNRCWIALRYGQFCRICSWSFSFFDRPRRV